MKGVEEDRAVGGKVQSNNENIMPAEYPLLSPVAGELRYMPVQEDPHDMMLGES